MKEYFSRHLQVLFATLGDMCRTPMSSLNTILIIAITLLLPGLLYVGVKSAEGLSDGWQGRPQISIFLQKQISEDEAKLIFDEIRLNPAVSLAEFMSPQEALGEFRMLSGIKDGNSRFDEELAFLGENPLPASIVIMPNNEYIDSEKLTQLKQQLSGFDGIDSIRLDLEWTNRFNAILKTVTQIAILLSGLLAIGLILIVGNTIKLLIVNRRHEIEVIKLVGGTNTFVRRPFLYYGTLFGFIGGLICIVLLLAASIVIKEPMNELAAAYQSSTILYSPTALDIAFIIFVSSFLGWVAARWSVAQHLRQVKAK